MRSRGVALLSVVVLVAGISITCGDDPTSSPASPSPPTACTAGEIRLTVLSTTTGGGAQPVGLSGLNPPARHRVAQAAQ